MEGRIRKEKYIKKKKKKPADGVWGSDSGGCRPREPFVHGQMYTRVVRACVST